MFKVMKTAGIPAIFSLKLSYYGITQETAEAENIKASIPIFTLPTRSAAVVPAAVTVSDPVRAFAAALTNASVPFPTKPLPAKLSAPIGSP
jgi:hypothetical protein